LKILLSVGATTAAGPTDPSKPVDSKADEPAPAAKGPAPTPSTAASTSPAKSVESLLSVAASVSAKDVLPEQSTTDDTANLAAETMDGASKPEAAAVPKEKKKLNANAREFNPTNFSATASPVSDRTFYFFLLFFFFYKYVFISLVNLL
jgi:hypothetical protein